MRARVRPVAALLALLMVLVGCSAGSTATVSGDEDTLAVGFTAEPENFDFTTSDGTAIPQALLYNVYENLVKVGPDGELEPLLAKSWSISADRTVYDFRLQPDARFSNGARFTAADVKFSIERVPTEWAISLKSKMDVVDRVEVIAPDHARVVLKQPSNAWLFDMASRVGAMFSRTGVSDLANNPIGTGPYTVAERRRGDSIVLRANPDYWGTQPGYRTVVLKYIADPTSLNNALLSNEIDVIAQIAAPDSVPQFEADERFRVIQGTTNGEVVLAYNNARPPLDDARVRRALTMAVDRQALLETAWAGRGELIGSMVPPTDPWYEDLSTAYPHDPSKARELLARAGVRDLSLRLRIANLPYATAAAQVVASDLAQIGVQVTIDPLDFPAVWLDEVFTKHDYDMSIVQHVEPYDIVTFGDPDFYWGYDSPRVQRLLAQADSGSLQARNDKMREAARVLAEDAAANWLFLFPNVIAAKSEVTGLVPNQVSESFDLTGIRAAR
ncbi:peptide/nickel transport system substrate-binding protein [Tamaricihabitans halophyticus]|uniref:Peptide/nickel transport system substrate-binding protein n=1 Tax=Tamaricihabitans halophyticus TaxID=1262583 RepID=A0A4V2STI4_9PSEU|nr:ABC transporter substrate-binding protein [Tamaricihabitans halophyticus]TCP50886.1 peptide/nickel transport system substrate-binding protein [Tamaricihabitans halophyticus]